MMILPERETQLVIQVKYHHGVRCLELECGHVIRDYEKNRCPGDHVVCKSCVFKKLREDSDE
jgi:hypothetical protein